MAIELLDDNRENFLRVVVAAAGRGDLEAVRELVEYNPAWIHEVGSHGRTMLWEAAYRGKKEVVEFLVEQGADVNTVGCHFSRHFVEITPYCVSKSMERDELAEYLLENGAVIDIHSAAYLGDHDLVLSLLEDDPALVNQEHAYSQRHDEPFFRATPVFYAVSGAQRDVLELLISRGADILSYGEKLLEFAMDRGNDLVQVLLENGLDPSDFNMGVPPKDKKLAEMLTAHGAKFDVNASHNGWPEIIYISRGDKGEHPEEILRLLHLGADVNIRNYRGKTALHYAAKAGFVRDIKVLMENGADINAADDKGETPLFDAIKSTIKNTSKKKAAVELLLTYGADPDFKSDEEITPLKVARNSRKEGADEIALMIQQAGGQ